MENLLVDNLFGEMISVYTRAQAIEDGVLIDVTDTAKEAGIKFPVALTSSVWSVITDIPKAHSYQDIKGRLWDLLSMFIFAIRLHKNSSNFGYRLIMHHYTETPSGKRVKTYLDLKAVCGPGDKGEPVITIMLPNED